MKKVKKASKKEKFTPEEGAIIRQAVESFGDGKKPNGFWGQVSTRVGGGKTARQCNSYWKGRQKKAKKCLCRFPGCQTPGRTGLDRFCFRHANQQPVTSKARKLVAKMKETQAKYYVRRYNTDPLFRLAQIVRNRTSVGLSNVIANPSQYGRTIYSYIGCTWAQLFLYIEAQFMPGMTWMNAGLWHIDHIQPIASFNLSDPIQRDRAFRWSNVRPMWGNENLRKSAKPTPAFDWCPNQNRWMWGHVERRLPADRHHVNIDLESIENDTDDENLNYQLDNEEGDADNEEEDADDEEEDP